MYFAYKRLLMGTTVSTHHENKPVYLRCELKIRQIFWMKADLKVWVIYWGDKTLLLGVCFWWRLFTKATRLIDRRLLFCSNLLCNINFLTSVFVVHLAVQEGSPNLCLSGILILILVQNPRKQYSISSCDALYIKASACASIISF